MPTSQDNEVIVLSCDEDAVMCQEAHIKNAYTTELLLTGILRQEIDLKEYPFDKACFPPGECVRANREKSNLIGWRQTLMTSPPSHIHFLLARAKNIAK